MHRRPAFWIAFALLSFVAAAFTLRNFSKAFPLVSVNLQMDRASALREARSIAGSNDWPPQEFDQAAEFGGDQELQSFIELEGGGKQELSRILRDKIFTPYTWRVRHFREADAHETLVRFTPEGERYGFQVKLPDQEKGASEPQEDALRRAEEAARTDWKIDFSRYRLVESSKSVLPGGRTDHTFVYERQDERIREGRYRLRLVVGGDKLTELTHFVQIPEAFSRRYEEMRSANDAINAAATVLVIGLYVLGFCGIGLFFMSRQRWILWRHAVLWAVFIALLMGLQVLNAWPLAWMDYDTALPAGGFAIRQVMTAFATFGALGVLLTISFIAAETLTRRAFPHQVQFWKTWALPVSSSRTILGQTTAGYLLVAPFFAYEIVLYFFAQERLGWWTPSDTLANPDMFANYVPALSAVSLALQAGFWEECLFRAVPLATAALIGDRFGKRRAFIAAAMLLQALVFAAGHAGYANQPAYARVVELILPSFAFGFLYLLFGLLPGIVLHFVYDIVWMALPLFASSGLRAHIEQAIVIFAALVPFLVVLISRWRSGKWLEVPTSALNGAWHPPEVEEGIPPAPAPELPATSISPYVVRGLPLAGLAGLVVWILAAPFQTDAPPIRVSRSDAEQIARRALDRRGLSLDSSWTVLSHVEGQPGEVNRFVWQTAGEAIYEKLLGVYVTPPSWVVRFARFYGDVAERAEEYNVYIDGAGRDFRLSHQLAEARPGQNLSESEARMIALAALSDQTSFQEISAQAAKRPARTDWTFVFKDRRDYGLPQGEPRITIDIAGDEVADVVRHVYVPEDWSRTQRAQRDLPAILAVICLITTVAIVVAAAAIGAVHWSRKRPFSARAFGAVFTAVFLADTLNIFNGWPILAAQASTAQPLELQAGIGIVVSLVLRIFTAAGLGLAAGLVAGDLKLPASLPLRNALMNAICVGLAIAGAAALARQATTSLSPLWGNLAPASAFVPFAAAALSPPGGFITQTLILLSVLYGVHRAPHASVVWLFVGIAIAGTSIETIPSWLVTGAITGAALMIAYRLVFQHQPQLLVITTATLAILSAVREAMQYMYPGALAGSLAGAFLVAAVGWIWFRGTMKL